jgi:hypothetical protein
MDPVSFSYISVIQLLSGQYLPKQLGFSLLYRLPCMIKSSDLKLMWVCAEAEVPDQIPSLPAKNVQAERDPWLGLGQANALRTPLSSPLYFLISYVNGMVVHTEKG